jgi:hypothetical protein
MPTPKTATLEYDRYIGYALEHMERILSFYNANRGEMRLSNYQGKQRVQKEMGNIFLNGGK